MPNNGTLVGSPTFAAAATGFGQAILLTNNTTAGTQYVSISDPGSAVFAAGSSWTIEGRFYHTDPTNLRILASRCSPPGVGSTFDWYVCVYQGKATFAIETFVAGDAGSSHSAPTALSLNAWHSYSLVMSAGATLTFYVDGVSIVTITGTYSPAGGSLAILVGGYYANTIFWNGLLDEFAIYRVAKYQAAYTPATAASSNTRPGLYGLYHFDGDATDSNGVVPVTAQVICKGDSLTYGQYASSGAGTATGTTYPAVLANDLGPAWAVTNLGISGETVATMIANFSAESAGKYSSSYATQVVVIEGLTNDIGGTTSSAATLVASLSQLCGLWRGLGFKVVVTTVPHACYGGPALAPGTYPRQGSDAFDPAADACNAIIRSTWSNFADALADYAADSRFADETNATYRQSDWTHYSDAGYAAMAGVVETAVLSAATGLPTYTAASNVRLGTNRGDGVTGTLAVPSPINVAAGVATDNTVGTLAVDTGTLVLFGAQGAAAAAIEATPVVLPTTVPSGYGGGQTYPVDGSGRPIVSPTGLAVLYPVTSPPIYSVNEPG